MQFTYYKIHLLKAFSLVVFYYFHRVVQQSSLSNSRIFSLPWKKCHTLQKSLPILFFTQFLVSTNLLPVATDLPVLDISCKYSDALDSPLWRASNSLSIMLSRFIQYCSVYQDFISILWPTHIPLFEYTIFCLLIYSLIDIWVFSIFWILWIMPL